MRLPLAPELLWASTLGYRSRNGIWSALSFNYMAGRYMDVSPLRRMGRALDSAHDAAAMIRQEPLPPAATVDLTFYKSFRTRIGTFDIYAVVNNLLNARDIVYNGYEQTRLRASGSGANRTYVPFPSKYLYAYSRTWYLRLGYRF
jgi:hypothetical protein